MSRVYPNIYQHVIIDDISIFYRTAGNPKNPPILLFHGFPSASHMFRDLMPLLAADYYLRSEERRVGKEC